MKERDLTIELQGDDLYAVYEHDEYPEDSVNAGLARRTFLACFDTLGEARVVYPTAQAIEGSTRQKPYSHPSPWPGFDPQDAGEEW